LHAVAGTGKSGQKTTLPPIGGGHRTLRTIYFNVEC